MINYDFDIAAILIEMILIFFYCQKKNVPNSQNRVFLMFVYVLTFSSIMEIITSQLKQYSSYCPMWIQWLMECLYYTGTNTLGIVYTLYCSAILQIRNDSKISKRANYIYRVALYLPYFIALLIIWLTPVLKNVYPLAFDIMPVQGYVRNNNIWFYMLYGITGYYIIFGFVLLTVFKSKISASVRFILSYYIFVVAGAAVLQMLNFGLLIQCFFISLATLIFFFCIQKPEVVVDSITGAFNQIAFMQIANRQIKKDKLACIFILLDDTVFMGNTLGFAQLNNFLKEVAQYLITNFSYYDVFSFSQECFCVTIKNPTEEKVAAVTNQLQERFKKTWMHDSVALRLYSRFCVVNCPEDATTAEDILDIISMTSSDERYKKPLIYAKDIDLEDKRRTVYIEHALRNGLTENRFDVYYQPIYSVADKTLVGAEALIRLKDEKGRFISPEDFIPIAEKSGTILRIGEFVYESVCRTLSTIDIEKYGIKKIDINLSVAQCMQEILAEQILSIQSIYQIPTSIINLEITETAAAHTPEILLKNMQTLADAGFELSLDDYGSGYSNMNYMLNLPFKMIKIDKYIVWAAYADEKAEIALAATIKMIKELGMTVLAEGVEEKDQADWLIELGCDYLQGYYYSRPVPKKEFLNIMLDNK